MAGPRSSPRARHRHARRFLAAVAAGGIAGCSANLASGPPSDTGPIPGPRETTVVASKDGPVPTSAAAKARAPAPAATTTPAITSAPKAELAETKATAALPPADPPPANVARTRARTVSELAKASAENPADATLAMAYVRALKSGGKRAEALAVLEAAADANPDQPALKVEQGLLALELGQAGKARGALEKAAPGTQDWRVLSALGVALSSQGQQQEAQRQFAKALELSPNNAVVLNNIAMSLLLDRKVDQAEAMLRRAARAGAARQQVAQNLALAKALKTETVEE